MLAHQGGWDEILLVLAPIALFAALLRLANRRANEAARARRLSDETGSEGPHKASGEVNP